jgi:hypothetical protein
LEIEARQHSDAVTHGGPDQIVSILSLSESPGISVDPAVGHSRRTRQIARSPPLIVQVLAAFHRNGGVTLRFGPDSAAKCRAVHPKMVKFPFGKS